MIDLSHNLTCFRSYESFIVLKNNSFHLISMKFIKIKEPVSLAFIQNITV